MNKQKKYVYIYICYICICIYIYIEIKKMFHRYIRMSLFSLFLMVLIAALVSNNTHAHHWRMMASSPKYTK